MSWFLWVYTQGSYHLYRGFERNEYFVPRGGLRYFGASLVPWLIGGAACALALWALLAYLLQQRRQLSWAESCRALRGLGLPSATLALQPLLGLAGVPATLVPIFHAVLACGFTVGLVANALVSGAPGPRRGERIGLAVLAVLMAAHFLTFASLNIRQYRALNLGFHDSGQIAEGYHQTFRGHFMMSYNQPYQKEPGPATSMDHLFWTRVLALPIFWLFPYHETILAIHAFALAFGALPVFLLARHVLNRPLLAIGFSVAYLFCTATLYLEFRSSYGPSEESQAIALFLAACYCMTRSRPWWCIFWAACAMAVKENMAPTAAMIGIWMAVFSSHKRHGVGLALGAVAYFIIGSRFILPLINRTGENMILNFYFKHLGDSYPAILWRIVSDPMYILGRIAEYRNLSFVLHLLVPVACLSLLSPSRLAILLPSLFFLLLSDSPTHHYVMFWNHASLVPIIFFSAIHGSETLNSFLADRKFWIGDGRVSVVCTVLACSLLAGWLFFFRMLTPATFDVTPRKQLVRELRALIPTETSLFSTHRLSAHFTENLVLHDVNNYLPDGEEYAVFDPLDRWIEPLYAKVIQARDLILQDSSYGLIYKKQHFFVFRKGAPRNGLWDPYLMQEVPEMDVRVDQVQHGKVRLLGWNTPERTGQRSLKIESFWECLEPVDQEYEVVIRLKLSDDETATTRHLVADWLYPTTIWREGDIVRDVGHIDLERDIPADLKLAIHLAKWKWQIAPP